MRKVIKNTIKAIIASASGVLLAALLLPLAGSLALSVPAVQNAIARRLAKRATEVLGARVSIDRVALRKFNHVTLSGFYVEDLSGDTLLYVPHLEAPLVDIRPLAFGRVRIRGAQFWLRKSSADQIMNISRLVDSIPDGNGTRIFRMRIGAIEADSLTFGLLRPYAGERENGVDFSRFVMRGVRTRIEDFEIVGDTIRMDIKSLSATDRSGWRVENLEAYPLEISRGAVQLTDAKILSEGSELHVPQVRLLSGERKWRHFSSFADSVDMGIVLGRSRVTSRLVGMFVPQVAGWDVDLDGVEARTRGVLNRLQGEIASARTNADADVGGADFALRFTSRDLPRLSSAVVDGRLTEFNSSGGEIAELMRRITGCTPSFADKLGRVGAVSATGEFEGGFQNFVASASLSTDAGSADVTASKNDEHLEGRISTSGVELGKIFAVRELGAIAGVVNVTAEGKNASVRGEVGALAWRGYNYTGLKIDAAREARKITARVTARDPNLRGSIDASIDDGRYRADIDLEHLDLAAVHINRRDSVSRIDGRAQIDITGATLDDMNGSVEITRARYISARDSIDTGAAVLTLHSEGGDRTARLTSRFVDAEAAGSAHYSDMAEWLAGFWRRYVLSEDLRYFADTGGPTTVNVEVKDAAQLLEAAAPTLAAAHGTRLNVEFDPATGRFAMTGRSEFLEYRGVMAANVEFKAHKEADSMVVALKGSDIYSGRGNIRGVSLSGGSRGRTTLDLTLGESTWTMAVDSMGSVGGRLGIDNFSIRERGNPARLFSADGVVGALSTDTLRVRFNRFDLSPVGGFIPRSLGLGIEGRATGWLEVASVRARPTIDADIDISELAVGGHAVAPLNFESHPRKEGGVGYRLRNERSGGDVLRGTLTAAGTVDAIMRIDGANLALLDPMLYGILERTRGEASAWLRLGGKLSNLNANGHIDVERFETTVGYTRARYGVESACIDVENSVLRLSPTPVVHEEGGSGDIALNIDLSDFRNIRTSIDANTDRLLAFDTNGDDSGAFYGRVFATGAARIRSGRMGTQIDISARTDGGTRFHLPLNAKANVAWADFVEFASRRPVHDTIGALARRRMEYERGGTDPSARRRKPLEVNITVSVTPAAEVHMLIAPNLGPGITARGEGVIAMRVNPANDQFTMTGDYNITGGRFEFSMVDIFNKTFEIAPGSTLRWSGAPADALLSVDASWRVRTSLSPLTQSEAIAGRMVPVDCIIRLRERLSDPEITFDIALPSADVDARQIVTGAMNTPELKSMQFLSLLTTGSFATDNSITGQTTGTGLMATGAVGFDILTNQINNFLSSDDYDVFFRYRPQNNFTSSQVEAGFSTRLWDERIELEIEGNYVQNRATTSVGTKAAKNLAGDVSLTWVIDRAGNLRLKVFSRTIDRLNETQGLQENGLGIYYRKDFDRLRDIFKRKRLF